MRSLIFAISDKLNAQAAMQKRLTYQIYCMRAIWRDYYQNSACCEFRIADHSADVQRCSRNGAGGAVLQGRRLGDKKKSRTKGPLFESENKLIWICRCFKERLCLKSLRSTLLDTIFFQLFPPTAGVAVLHALNVKNGWISGVVLHISTSF